MGRALARHLVGRGDRVVLLGRNADELAQTAADLRVRAGREDAVVGVVDCNLEDDASFGPALADAWQQAGGRLDGVIVTAGQFGTQEQLEADRARTHKLLLVNFTNTVTFCEEARERLLAQPGGGTLCVFSSVAGDASRKPVAIYGASKAGLSHYLGSIDLRYRPQGLHVVCVKPGFVHTTMTAGLKPPPFAGQPEQVAQIVARALDRGTPVVYAPAMWGLVMLVIRNLPRFVMRKLSF